MVCFLYLQAESYDGADDPDSAPSSPASESSSTSGQADMPSGGPFAGTTFSQAEATGDSQSLGAEKTKKKSALRE